MSSLERGVVRGRKPAIRSGPPPKDPLLPAAIELVERLDCVVVLRLSRLLLQGGIGAVEDSTARVDRFRSRVLERPIRSDRASIDTDVCDADRGAPRICVRSVSRGSRRQRVEHFVTLRLRRERFDAPNGQCLHGHNRPTARCAGGRASAY
jgi:hypothetical protein